VGIVLNKEQRKQAFFFEHLDDIISLAIHPNKKYIATGEIGPHPLIAVWDSETLECLSRFNHPLQKGISNLCFSEDGKLLCACSADDEHSIAVFEWEKCHIVENKKEKKVKINGLIASGKGTKSVILSLCFNKSHDSVVATCTKVIIN
jgi:microtubule-associated protein-like 6